MNKEIIKNVVEYQSDKEKTLRDALLSISQSDRFLLVTFHENTELPIGVIGFCDDGLEQRTLIEGSIAIHQAIGLIKDQDGRIR